MFYGHVADLNNSNGHYLKIVKLKLVLFLFLLNCFITLDSISNIIIFQELSKLQYNCCVKYINFLYLPLVNV
jgi:hypothetical protein